MSQLQKQFELELREQQVCEQEILHYARELRSAGIGIGLTAIFSMIPTAVWLAMII